MVPRVHVVAGSDCSGGAGLQADIKTLTALGVYASSTVTALTVQDGGRVHEVQWVSPLLIERQMECALADVGADAVKIGMLGSALAVELVARVCETRARTLPIVIDPVLESSTGAALLEPDAVHLLLERLLPQAALVTPNIHEVRVLTGIEIQSPADMWAAADQFQLRGVSAVLIKGGHLPGDRVIDLLRTADGDQRQFESERLPRTTRGTGCTLAAGIAAGLAEGLTLEGAIERARDYLSRALARPPELDCLRAPLFHAFPCASAP